MATDQTVAVLGAGRMGAAMVRTLRRSGFDVVVFNRNAEPVKVLVDEVGATAADTPREAAAAADVVISSLADDAAVVAVYSGSDGAAAGLREGAVVLEMSTIDPSTVALPINRWSPPRRSSSIQRPSIPMLRRRYAAEPQNVTRLC